MQRRGDILMLAVTLVVSSLMQGAFGQFSTVPDDIVVNASASASVTCSYENATAIWWEDPEGFTISNGAEFMIESPEPPESSTLTIPSADPVHTGRYTCVAELEGGVEMMTSFDITVQFIGRVRVELEMNVCSRNMVFEGGEFTLECVVEGSFPPVTSVSWFREHDTNSISHLSSANTTRINVTGSRLSITNVVRSDDGLYFCGVDNGPLERNSSTRLINVMIPRRETALDYNGMMIESGTEILVKESSSVTINCVITPPYPPISVKNDLQWNRGGAGLTSGDRFSLFVSPPRACNFTLVVQAFNGKNHSGPFYCQVRGEMQTRATFTLTLARIPAEYNLTATPETNVLGVGRDITFECLASGVGPTPNVEETISWEFIPSGSSAPGAPVANGNRFTIGARTLSISSLQVSDSGTYVCVADHRLVEPIRTMYNLAVEAGFVVRLLPVEPMRLDSVRLGTAVTLSCEVTADLATPRSLDFTWVLDGTPVTSSSRLNVTSGPLQSTLRIANITEPEVGVVWCNVSDPYHLPVSESLTLVESPTLYLRGNTTSRLLMVPEGSVLVLECPLRSRPDSVTVQWFHGARLLDDSDADVSITTSSNGSEIATLEGVASLARDEGDKYQCVVTDEAGSRLLTYNVTIFITIPPNITEFPPPTVLAEEGSRVQLDCKVTGRPSPNIMWFRSDGSLNVSHVRDFMNGTLVFANVTISDSGNYICFIGTPVISHDTTLMVRMRPDDSSGNMFPLNEAETILVFVLVGIVLFFLLFLICPMMIIIGCWFCIRRVSEGKYSVNTHGMALDSGSLKQGSLRSGKESSASHTHPGEIPKFSPFPDNPSPEPSFELEERYMSNAVPLHTFAMGGVGERGGVSSRGGAREPSGGSMLTDSPTASPMRGTMVTPSHASVVSPMHETVASSSLIASEEHTTLENGLPSFPRNNIKLGELMGQGEFGPVMKAVARNLVVGQAETEVAVKLLVTEEGEGGEDSGFRADLAVVDYANQMKLEYRSIASILGLCSEKEPYYVIYEYLDKGDLKNFLLQSRPEEGVPPRLMSHELLKMIGQVADGMAYLFSQRIIHGDIAARNCLVSSSLQVKIGDLGIGHELYTGDYYDNGAQLLPIRWMPPELLTESEEGPSFSLHSDAWSFGVFCWEVMSYAKLPYENYSDEDVLAMVPAGSRLRSPGAVCPPTLYLVMMECWNEVPERRPQFTKILSALATINLNE